MNRFAVAASVAVLALGGAGAPMDQAGAQTTRAAITAGSAPQLVNLPRGTSFAVDLPSDARDVIISNPRVAEAMLHSPRRITMIGLEGARRTPCSWMAPAAPFWRCACGWMPASAPCRIR
ncbi:pilus assembly protein N-terminal domain-containing protein [Brevundimonas sp. LF-1]|uniref:pilus assembly protein N-terminal domain-containing protein n=1 Tax=Brevundimonas sp. LF-1 TaxID=3126100 RepID=UPI0030DE9D37